MAPAVVIRPILLASVSVNHRFPSGPLVMNRAKVPGLGIVNSALKVVDDTTNLPILFAPDSMIQRFPSGPDTSPLGEAPTLKPVTVPDAIAIRQTLFAPV